MKMTAFADCMCVGGGGELEDSLQVPVLSLLSCGFWEWSSGYQAWQQVPLPLSHLASPLVRMIKRVVIIKSLLNVPDTSLNILHTLIYSSQSV